MKITKENKKEIILLLYQILRRQTGLSPDEREAFSVAIDAVREAEEQTELKEEARR